jgi:hypothetical protein
MVKYTFNNKENKVLKDLVEEIVIILVICRRCVLILRVEIYFLDLISG